MRKEFDKAMIGYIELNLEKVSKPFALFFKNEFCLSHNQMSTLWYLQKDEKMTMGEFSNKMSMSKQQATKLIELLVSKELIQRSYDSKNRRVILISLTPLGYTIIEKVKVQFLNNAYGSYELLPIDDQERIINAISTINELLPKFDLNPKKHS